MNAILIQKLDNGSAFKLAATFGFVSLAGIALYKWIKKIKALRKAFNFNPMTMERFIFNWKSKQNKHIAEVIHQDKDCRVKIDGAYAGTMFKGEQDGEWYSEDKALKSHMEELVGQLSNVFSLQGFPAILQGNYPQVISTNWKTSETLELQLSADTDMETFAAFLADEVPNLVNFPEYLDLIVKKKDESYFKIISVNIPHS